MPKVSIIVPVYKVEQYICDCLDSIKGQTFTDWECLLVDDGSPDKSGQICDEYVRVDSRFKVFHEKNGGVSNARNIGLEQMSGEWVMFVDSDDAIALNTLEYCIDLVEKNRLDLLQFPFTPKKENLGTQNTVETGVLERREFINTKRVSVCIGGSLFKTSIIRNSRLFFDTRLKLAEDQLFVFNFINRAKRFQKIGNCFYWYRVNVNSASHKSKTDDILCSMKTLVGFKKLNRFWSAYIDRINVVFLINIIYNDDKKIKEVKRLISDAEITDLRMIDCGFPALFCSVARFSRTLAIMLTLLRKFLLKVCHV